MSKHRVLVSEHRDLEHRGPRMLEPAGWNIGVLEYKGVRTQGLGVRTLGLGTRGS